MATAVIPIIATLAPVVVPWLVTLIEKVFPPKSGPAKLTTVTNIVQVIANALASATASSAGPVAPTDATVAVVQQVVNELKAAGVLNGAATIVPSVVPLVGAAGSAAGVGLNSAIEILQWLAAMPAGLAVK